MQVLVINQLYVVHLDGRIVLFFIYFLNFAMSFGLMSLGKTYLI